MQKPFVIAAVLGSIAFALMVVLLFFSPVEVSRPILQKNEKLSEEQFVQQRLANLSTEDKVRQLMIWTVTGPDVSDETMKTIEQLQPGGVMISGTMNHTDLLRLTVRLRSLKAKIPLIIAIDQEGGAVRRFSEDELSDPHVLGSATDKEFCTDIQDSSRWLSELGVNLNFGIIADIAWEPDSYIYSRSYGSDPQTVSKHVIDAITCTIGVMTTVKHFPGHGRTKDDSHYIMPSIPLSYEEWQKTDAVPFKAAIQSNVDAIMMGHLIYPDIASEPASLSPRFISEARQMGFKGLIITDDMGMLEATGLDPNESLKQSMVAGNDMLLYANTQAEPEELVKQAVGYVQDKSITEKQLNEHVERIFKAKYRF